MVLLTRHDNYTEAYYYRNMIKFDLGGGGGGGEGVQKIQGGTCPPLPPPETDIVIIIIQQLVIKISCVKVICLIQIIPCYSHIKICL